MRGAPTPLLLLGAVGVVLLGCALASGGIQLPERAWVTVALALLALLAMGGCLYGRALRFRAHPLALAGLAGLALFAVWTGVSIAWSVQPDRSWTHLNLALAYVLVLGLGVAVGASLERAPQRTAQMLVLVTLPVALYALAGKTVPGILGLDHAGSYNRLKAPLEYWNALALFCVFGLLPALRLAADPRRSARRRIAALLAVFVLVLVVTLTYSRGGMLALAVGLAVLVGLGTERVRTALAFGAALLAAGLPLTVALTQDDLTTDYLPLAQRTDDALVVLVCVVVAAALLAAAAAIALRLEQRPSFTPQRARRVGRPLALGAAVVLVLALVASLATGRVAEAFDSFTDTEGAARVSDPNRLLSANSGNRWTWWKEAAGAWADKPVAGWGAGSFPVTHRFYREDNLTVQQPHSVPLQWLAEVGLVGFLLAAGALLALLAAALAHVRATPWAVAGAPPERGYAAALLAVAAAWVAHAFYDWDWDIPAVTLPALFVLGVLGARPAPPRLRPPEWRAAALACAGVAFVLVATSALLPAAAKSRTESVLASIGDGPVDDARLAEAEADAEVAARLNPLAVEPLFAVATIARRRGREADEREALLRALERQPDSVAVWVKLAAFSFVRGDARGVRRASRRALKLDPRNPGLFDLARRADAGVAPPNESATATGSPLPTAVTP